MTKIIEVDRPRRTVTKDENFVRVTPAAKGLKFLAWAGVVVVLALLTWARLPAMARKTVWAEDGGVFLKDVLSHGQLRSIALPYDGYLHVLPRTLASVAHALAPLQGYALAMSLMSCFVVALVSVAVFHLSRSVSASVPVRCMIAVIPVLLPIGPEEVLGNAANLHWFLLWLMPWLLLYKPKSPVARGTMFVVAFVSAASEIITGMFLPLALWTMFRRRSFAAPAGLLLGIGVQLLTTFNNPRFAGAPLKYFPDGWSVFMGFGLLPIGSIWHPDSRTLGSNIVSFGAWSLLVPALLVLGLLVYTVVTGRPELKIAAIGTFIAAWICWIASVMQSGNIMFNYANFTEADWTGAGIFGYMRYAAAPAMFLLLLLPLAVAAALERRRLSRPSSALVAWFFLAFLMVSYFPATTFRQDGPDWSAGVNSARAACQSDQALSSSPVLVAPAGWKFAQVQIPCQELRGR